MKVVAFIVTLMTVQVCSVFRDASVEEGGRPEQWFDDPLWANYTEFNVTDTSIKLAWRSPYNSGFHYNTQIEKCTRNDTALRASKLALYPTWTNHTYFYENFITDEYWEDCNIHETDRMVAMYTFYDLTPGTAYRFKIRMVDNATNSTTFTNWTPVRPLATLVRKQWQEHEYSILHVRGTGLNNHNSSFIKIDDNVLLDHAYYVGFYLLILDRRDLSIVHSNFYNTSIHGGKDSNMFIDDFRWSREMATEIKKYGYSYFVVVVS